jgi:hypothetical protein
VLADLGDRRRSERGHIRGVVATGIQRQARLSAVAPTQRVSG